MNSELLFMHLPLLSVDGALTSIEGGLKPSDHDQMSGRQELMSVVAQLMASV